ncbi:MAG TPA: PEP-utilizing enzyme [Candidatus Nanopelagicales bacterium]|nr:PEP-utilizing enzyme [Candidatus Nanopelagicales bacterium]
MMDPHDSFQVQWDNPEDAQAFWVIDLVHCPAPMSQLDFDLRMAPFVEGLNLSQARYALPVRTEPRLIHGFLYQKIISEEISLEALPGVLSAADATARRDYAELARRWETAWLPEIRTLLAALEAFDLRGASLPALLEHLAVLRRRIVRLWELHNDLLLPTLVALSDFDDAYRALFPEAKPLDVYDLLAGFPNKTLEANLRLWEIGREAARATSLRALLAERPAAELLAELANTEEGRALQRAIEEYVRAYGERSDDLYINAPTWIDAPTPVLRGIKEAALAPERDLAAETHRQAERRDARLAEVRAAIAAHPRPVVEEFEALLEAAQAAPILSEDHHFWIDCKITHHARRLSLEVGRRLVERGSIDSTGDVFHLSLAELFGLADPAADASHLRALVTERRAEAARFADAKPPTILGVPRPLLPMDCAIMRASFKFNGNLFGPPSEGSDLQGLPGSGGKVRGRARIVRTLEDAEKLQRGEILVAPFTLPSWTPFFATAAGVVTNIGGMLCHAAVVAREYGIPAVVGTQRGTEALRDGQLIEVDGDVGVVRVVES